MKLIMENWRNWSNKTFHDKPKKYNVIGPIYFAVWDHHRMPLHHYEREGVVEFVGEQPREGRRVLYWYKTSLSEEEMAERDKKSTLKNKFGIRHVVKTNLNPPDVGFEVIEQ